MRVFLGGTCNGSNWRDEIIPSLSIDFYNPVKDEWNEEAYHEEIQAKLDSNYFLYCLTPKYTGFFSFAEVINESFHYSNQTIFCFLTEDGTEKFSKDEIESLKELGSRVVENGGLWFENLEEVTSFLNSTQENRVQLSKYDFFISYGRKHSSSLASKLNHSFIKEGKTVWMDKFCIPTGVDFQISINDGITKSDNFIYIISPYSVQSEYCTKELEVALKYGKRIIPILHIMEDGLEDLMHPEIQKLNWFYFDSERKFQHGFSELIKTTSTDSGYLESNTKWLQKAVEWDSNDRNRDYLLGETETILAEAWYDDAIEKEKSPPPSDLNKEFINVSVDWINQLKKRKKRNGYIIRALSVVMTIASVIAVIMFFQAETARGIAVNAKEETEIERDNAKKAERAAEDAREEAVEAEKEAVRQKQLAQEEERKAKKAENEATDAKDEAEREREIALQAKEDEIKAKDEANEAKDLAVENAKIAKEEAKKSSTLLLIDYAKELFSQANEIKEENTEFAKKIALFAYEINKEFNDNLTNQDAFELANYFQSYKGKKLDTKQAIKKIKAVKNKIFVHDLSGNISELGGTEIFNSKEIELNEFNHFDINSKYKKLIISNAVSDVHIYEINDNSLNQLSQFKFNRETVIDVLMTGNFAYILTSRGVYKLNPNTNKSERILTQNATKGSKLKFNSNNLIAIIKNNIYNITKNNKYNLNNKLTALCFLDNENVVCGDVDGKIYHVNINQSNYTPKRIGVEKHNFEISSIRYSNKNNLLYTCSVDETVKMWPLNENYQQIREADIISHNGYLSWVRDINFVDKSQKWLAIGGDKKQIKYIPAKYDFIYENFKNKVVSLNDEELNSLIKNMSIKDLNKIMISARGK